MANTSTLVSTQAQKVRSYILHTAAGKDLGVNSTAVVDGILFIAVGRVGETLSGRQPIHEVAFAHDGTSGEFNVANATTGILAPASDEIMYLVGMVMSNALAATVTFDLNEGTNSLALDLAANQGVMARVEI